MTLRCSPTTSKVRYSIPIRCRSFSAEYPSDAVHVTRQKCQLTFISPSYQFAALSSYLHCQKGIGYTRTPTLAMDINDILAAVTRDHHDALGTTNVEAEATQKQQDLQLLTRAWVSERVTPELLPYPSDLMVRVMQRIRDQVSVDSGGMTRTDSSRCLLLAANIRAIRMWHSVD